MKLLILGNGQLGQMLAQSSIQLGHECLLVNTRTNKVMPAGAHVPLSLSIEEAMQWAEIVSWEHEQLDPDHVALAAAKLLTDADKIRPLTHRQLEKKMCDDLGIPTAPWQSFQTADQFSQALQTWQEPVVIKAAFGGYDGKSQWRWNPQSTSAQTEAAALERSAGLQAGIIESMIPFSKEMSIVGARAKDGRILCYPLVENVHTNGILSHTFAGFEHIDERLQATAEEAFRRITEHLGYVGTLAIEFFVVGEGDTAELLVNEIAPRVHNSGHWSLSGCNASQFDLHIRSLTNMPFPELAVQPTLMLNAIGCAQIPAELWQDSRAQAFWYGKDSRPGRKVGHVNMRISSRPDAEALCKHWTPSLQVLS